MMRSFQSLTDIFENTVDGHPAQIALVSYDRKITYHELNQYSNKIAHFLISRGLQGQNIGILLNRSPEIIMAIFGILKAGCSYVFLDPKNPAERVRYILENSDTGLLITQKSPKVIDGNFPVPRAGVDDILSAGYPAVNPDLETSTDRRAYIMYTSGSTGKPKGVEIMHSNVISYINAIKTLFELLPGDVYLHTASFSFSSSIRQYLVPLLNGNSLCIAGEKDVLSLQKLLSLIRDENVTIFDSTPMLWKYGLIQIERLNINKRNLLFNSDLRLLVFSGDTLPAQLIQKIRTICPNPLKIINVCGQTESIGGMAYPVPEDFSQKTGIVPIGFPLSNTQIEVLDGNLHPVKDGEIGELYISSPSVGLGYYKNPVLTKSVFTVNRTSGDGSCRTLKSGDLVRYWENKPMEIMGRLDFQVKIRGIRIDLNEIENMVLRFPSVSECVVVGTAIEEEELMLVCFVVAETDMEINTNELKKHLRKVLLDAYIPDRIVSLEKLPVTPNGKVDRKYLQNIAAGISSENKTENAVTFKNETQKDLYYIFAKVLNTNNITFKESFFDMGGHSLKAVELVELMEKVFNKKIPLEFIYRYSSIDKLTLALEKIDNENETVNLVCLHPQGSSKPFFCVHGDDGNYFLSKYLGDDIPFYGFFHQGRNGDRVRYKDIHSIAAKYVDELFQVRPKGPYILGGYSIGGIIAHAMVSLIKKKEEDVGLLILIDSVSPDSHWNILPGRHLFNRDKVLYYMDDNQGTERLSWAGKVKSSLHNHFYRYGYHISHLFLFFGAKVPLYLRNSYIMGIYRRARKDFLPESLDVKTILLRSTIDNYEDYKLGWDRFIHGPLETFEIDSDHNTIIREPQVRILSEFIRKEITHA